MAGKQPIAMARRLEMPRQGAGLHRKPFQIKEWALKNAIRFNVIAKRAEVSPEMVSRTIHGNKNNRKVLTVLRDLGCPVDYLALPEDMQSEQAA